MYNGAEFHDLVRATIWQFSDASAGVRRKRRAQAASRSLCIPMRDHERKARAIFLGASATMLRGQDIDCTSTAEKVMAFLLSRAGAWSTTRTCPVLFERGV